MSLYIIVNIKLKQGRLTWHSRRHAQHFRSSPTLSAGSPAPADDSSTSFAYCDQYSTCVHALSNPPSIQEARAGPSCATDLQSQQPAVNQKPRSTITMTCVDSYLIADRNWQTSRGPQSFIVVVIRAALVLLVLLSYLMVIHGHLVVVILPIQLTRGQACHWFNWTVVLQWYRSVWLQAP